jgi:hypothetical protein
MTKRSWSVSESVSDPEAVLVWRAADKLRILSYGAILLLLLFATKVALSFGPLATIGILLVLAASFQVWWSTLRPRLTAGPQGVVMVEGREPVRLAWRDIRRCEVGPRGLKILCTDGRELTPRFPAAPRGVPVAAPDSEVARAAAYLTNRAAWSRKTSGPRPRY